MNHLWRCPRLLTNKWIRFQHKNHSESPNLLRELRQKIQFQGPMTVANYMQEVLTSPLSGYYTSQKEVLGAKGDFITSPEISQMFGECIAIWIIHEWHRMGSPSPLNLVELGPGRGTLMRDILRTFFKLVPEESKQVSVHLVEVSPRMKQLQEAVLCGYFHGQKESSGDHAAYSKEGNQVSWYRDLARVPKNFSFFIAHEFFDALPIHKFVKVDGNWHEVLVDVGDDGESLRLVRSRERTPNCVHIADNEAKTEVEISPKTGVLINELCQRITEDGGAALITDYGHDGDKGDTFRAFKSHQLHDPLKDPGLADITADVDFSYVRKNCSNTTLYYGPVEQGAFLHKLGIEVRKDQLLKAVNDEAIKKDIEQSYAMLTSPQEMGKAFKFFSIFPKTMAPIHSEYPPVGF